MAIHLLLIFHNFQMEQSLSDGGAVRLRPLDSRLRHPRAFPQRPLGGHRQRPPHR